MEEELYYGTINRHTDWGGDASTGDLPVAGSVVQDFIKSELNGKIGVIINDEVAGAHLCFACEEDKNEFLADRSKTHLILSSFIAPSKYKAKIIVDSNYKAVLINSKENYLTFTYEITNNDEVYVDNVTYTVSITKNGVISTINGVGVYGKPISINMDEFITLEGITEAVISIKGQTIGAEASYVVTYEVVNLLFESEYNVSQVYDLTKEVVDPLVIDYRIFGTSNVKYIDWYLDGEYLDTDAIQGGTAEVLVGNKRVSLAGFSHGVHNIQFRAYVVVNGENFYTDTLYREFMVVTDKSNNNPMIAIEAVIPKSIAITNSVKIYNVVQYESYNLSYGVYNPKNLEYVPVEIYLDEELSTSVNAPNNKELTYSFTSNSYGSKLVSFKIGEYVKTVTIEVEETTMDLQEINNNLLLTLSAAGRTNQDANREDWSYGEFNTTFEGFNWTAASGWNDNKLFIAEGMTVTTNIKPLASTVYGKTVELEFETYNVVNDDAVVCNVQDNSGLGMLITASKASLKVGFGEKEVVSTNYKANENVRISFVLDAVNKLAIIYVNGVMSGAVAMTSNLNIDKYLSFTGTSEAGIKLKQIRVYDAQLSAEQILNNYILYRDNIVDIKSLYNRNDILDGQFISIEKISDQIPVILLTGEEIYDLEADKDTDREIRIDVEYINKQDPTHQFKFYGGCCRIQGTSSAGYVRKNWRIYSKRKKKFIADVYDWQGVPVTDPDRRIAFKEHAVPVNCWTLKADFAESSSTHNTGVATLWNDVMYNAYHTTNGFVCRTNAQKAALENGYEYDCRTTVDGFPIVVFARRNDSEEYTFMGKYNFNNDKSTENVFGFCDIPGFDDAYVPGHEDEIIPENEMNAGKSYTFGNKMQCWEVRENSDPYALFLTTDGWYDPQRNADGSIKVDEDNIVVKSWASGFEARYPDDGNEADITDLKAFADWIVGCTQERFATEKYDHFDLWKMAAYYVYLMRFGAVDQVVKNSMFTSEDGKHWYFINYDNDTILGLDNSGNIVFPPTITRQTPSGSTYAYAGHDSKMWNMLEADSEFITYYVPEADNILFGGGLKYDNVLNYFNVRQSDKWCERVYNEDANYKYVKPYIAGTVNELVKMHGSRKSHRTWWLAKRFQLMDAKFSNTNYRGKHIHLKLDGSAGAEFTIKSADYMYFGCEYNKNPWAMGVELNKGESYTFYKASSAEDPVNGKDFVMGDPIYIYSPLYIEELDLSKISSYIYVLEFGKLVDEITSARMKKLIIGGEKSAKPVSSLSGLGVLTNLEYLDLTGIDYPNIDISNLLLLKTLKLTDSTINTLTLPEGGMIEELYLTEALKHIECNGLQNLTLENMHGFDEYHISSIKIVNSPNLTNDFGYYYRWIQSVKSGDSLDLSGIQWKDINPSNLIEFGKVKAVGGKLSLKGKIEIANPTIEEVEELQSIFGENCFTNNSELWISAPESVFIHGPKEVRSGDSAVYDVTIFSESPGTVEWQIESGNEFVQSIVSNPDNTGTLTTIEDENSDHEIILKAIHKPANTTADSYFRIDTYRVLVKKTIYATSGIISGNTTVKKDETFTLSVLPNNYNGDYVTEWGLTGESFENGKIALANQTNNSCVVKYVDKVIFDLCHLIAKVTNKNGTTFEVDLIITVSDDSVLMTSTSNPEVISICYAKGWCKSPDVMYKEEAQVITDIGTAFRGGSYTPSEGATGPRPGSFIKTFNEFEEFKNIKTLSDQAFFQCNQLSEIVLPINIETIGSFAFGSTNLSELKIPNNVVNIHYTAFEGTPIEAFSVGGAQVSYFVKNGVLIATDGTLVKYPEGKLDKSYTTDPQITKLGPWSIKNTKLESLTIGDNVVSHNDRSISDNVYIKTLNLGASIAPTNLPERIFKNSRLININVSEDHQSLCSIDGVVYNIDKTTLWKYPEGRLSFVIAPTVKSIGVHAVSNNLQLATDLIFPDHVEVIEANAFYGCQNVTGIVFGENSNLRTISANAFQLNSKVTYAEFPKTLQTIYANAFSSCWKLGNLKFLSVSAPVLENESVFGLEYNQWVGRDSQQRIVYVSKDAVGYEENLWNTLFDDSRSKTDSSGKVTYYNFTLSKTL